MKIHEILNEVPIEDYSVYGSGKDTPKLRQMKKPAVSRILHKSFANVNYNINVYALPKNMTKELHSRTSKAQRKQSANPEYYFQIDPSEIKDVLPARVANKIKFDPKGTTIIFQVNEEKSSFQLSPWSVIHDIIHGLTLTTKSAARLLDSIDKVFSDIIKQLPTKPEILKYRSEQFLANVLTMKSATSGDLKDRPEEASTELFTQWLFTGKITLAADRLAKEYDFDEATIKIIQKLLNRAIPKCIKLFKEILKEARGLVIVTGN